MSNTEQGFECSICGRDVDDGVPAGCEICHGHARPQARSYTLSDHRSGRAPKESRYGENADLRPAASPLVVGGSVNHPGNREN